MITNKKRRNKINKEKKLESSAQWILTDDLSDEVKDVTEFDSGESDNKPITKKEKIWIRQKA